jgi:hypothetical protein
LTRKVFIGILYPYNSDKINAQKSEILKKSMCTATGRLTDMPCVVLVYYIGVVG